MEDDVHHFGVVVRHCDGVVTNVAGTAWRTPWKVCPGAVEQLKSLEGLTIDAVRTLAPAERNEHCLHLLDLARLAVDYTGETRFERAYRMEVDHDAAPPAARLWRDGKEVLQWRIDGGHIRGSRFDGVAMADLARHLDDLSRDDAEAALLLLRRASLISFVRRLDLDAVPDSNAVAAATPANCYAKQPLRREHALRNFGSSRDFSTMGIWPLHARTER